MERITYANYLDPLANDFPAFYCINKTEHGTDALGYFGGIYEMCTTLNFTQGVCARSNHFTESCSCPIGYSSVPVSYGWSGDINYNLTCPWNYYDTYVFVQTFMCYNESVPLTETIIGGMFTNNTIYNTSSGIGTKCLKQGIVNSYTKTTKCPDGFDAYHIAQGTCDWDEGHPSITDAYVCLNNVYNIDI